MSELIAVKFNKPWRGYSAGEIAGFDQEGADRLVEGEVAELLGTSKPKAKSAKPKPANTPEGGSAGPEAGGLTPKGGEGASADLDDEAKP